MTYTQTRLQIIFLSPYYGVVFCFPYAEAHIADEKQRLLDTAEWVSWFDKVPKNNTDYVEVWDFELPSRLVAVVPEKLGVVYDEGAVPVPVFTLIPAVCNRDYTESLRKKQLDELNNT